MYRGLSGCPCRCGLNGILIDWFAAARGNIQLQERVAALLQVTGSYSISGTHANALHCRAPADTSQRFRACRLRHACYFRAPAQGRCRAHVTAHHAAAAATRARRPPWRAMCHSSARRHMTAVLLTCRPRPARDLCAATQGHRRAHPAQHGGRHGAPCATLLLVDA